MNTYSQAAQDIFVQRVTNRKRDGYFLEIGSNHPITHNNSFVLESEYGWKGLMVEYDKSYEQLYQLHRPNSIYELNDARAVKYRQIMDDASYPPNMDYLQVDLDVDNRSTLDTLQLLDGTVFDKYKFATVTFEHDIYTGNYFDTQAISREIFASRGYILVFPNVSVFWEGSYKPFEDWYVHPEMVDVDYINNIKTDDSLTVEQIKQRLVYYA